MALATCRTLLPNRSIDQHMRTSNRRRTASLSIRLNAGHWSRPSPTITARAAELGIERVLEKPRARKICSASLRQVCGSVSWTTRVGFARLVRGRGWARTTY